MDGKIYADGRAKCIECGSASSFNKSMRLSGFDVPLCKCGGHPNKFRLSSYYPDAGKTTGRSKTGDIRYTDTGERICDPGTAVYMLKQIEKEIELGAFNPDKYTSTQNRKKYLISHIADLYIEFSEKRLECPDTKITPRTLRSKKNIVKNYIKPIFGEIDIQQFHTKTLRSLFKEVKKNRRRVYEELFGLLKYAHQELEIRFAFPAFPPKPSMGYRDETDIPETEVFWQIVEKLDREQAKAISVICALYMLRPSDVLTMKPCDVDMKSGVLKIQRHASDGQVIEGRKSDLRKKVKSVHTLPIVPEFKLALELVPTPLCDDEYYFKGLKSPHKFFSFSSFNNAWKRAREAAGHPKVQFYTAVKHARARDLLARGISMEIIERIAGVRADVLRQHYLRLRASDVKDTVLQFDTARAKRVMGA